MYPTLWSKTIMVKPDFYSKCIPLGILVTMLIELVTTALAVIPVYSFQEERVSRKLDLYMIWTCSLVLCIAIGLLGNNVFRRGKFSNYTGLWIFISLLTGVILVVHVLTTNIYPNFGVSLTLAFTNESLIFILVVCISNCYTAFEDREKEKQKTDVFRRSSSQPSTSHGQQSYFIPLGLSERNIPTQDLRNMDSKPRTPSISLHRQ